MFETAAHNQISKSRTLSKLILIGILVWAAVAVAVPAGLLQVDEVVQFAAIAALADTGRLTVENGSGLPSSPDLHLIFLREGPNGLAAQYPAGQQVIAAPFLWLGGIRGLYLLNLVGGVASLALTFAIARRLSDRETALLTVAILFGATFLVEYSTAAIWPHAPALAFGLTGVWCAIHAADATRLNRGAALGGGLAMGIGISLRLDIALLLSGLGAWFLLNANRPFRHGALAAAGMVPPIAFLSLANNAKFGTYNPLSYGTSGSSGTSLSGHLEMLAALFTAGLLVLLWRHLPAMRKVLIGCITIIAVCALALIPELRDLVGRIGRGAWLLVVDLSSHPEAGVRRGVEVSDSGLVTFWGIHKKALLQSLPWLGLIVLALHPRARHNAGAGLALGALIAISIILPFTPKAWHGGYGSNMRYFLCAVPFLAFAAAVGLRSVAPPPSATQVRSGVYGFGGTILMLGALGATFPSLTGPLIEHRLPPLLAAIVLAGAFWALADERVRPALRPVAGVALGWAAFSAYTLDLPRSLGSRAWSADVASAYATAPVDAALFYDSVIAGQAPILRNPEQIAAAAGHFESGVDPDLVTAAMARGLAIVTRQDQLQADLEAVLRENGITFTTATIPGRHPLTITRAD